MKKYLSFILPLAILVGGCSQEESLNEQNESLDGRTFIASFEEGKSRTYLEEEKYLRWTTDDRISIFDGNTYNQQYKFDGETGANSGSFSPITKYATGNDLPKNYAVYPYAEGTSITESGIITVTLPVEQSYAENSFGSGANTMVAVTEDTDDTFLKFKNVGGYLKLQLYGKDVTVKSITLQGNSNEKIAGEATLAPVFNGEPTTTMSAEATQTITLDCGDGIALNESAENAKAFWLVVPPTTFAEGFTIIVKDVNGGEFTKSTSKSIELERNTVQPMSAFEVNGIRSVNVSTAGTLSSLISDTEKYQILSLKVVGCLNGSDISFLQNMSKGSGSLTYLDLSETYIVSGGSSYDYYNKRDDSGDCNTKDNVFGKHMFRNCKLGTIILPNTVTSIGSGVLSGCTNLTSIVIPKNIQSIDFSYSYYGNPVTFQDTPLKEIIVDDDNPNFSVSDGVLFNKDKTMLIKYPQGRIGDTSLVSTKKN